MKPIFKIIIVIAVLAVAGFIIFFLWKKFTALPKALPQAPAKTSTSTVVSPATNVAGSPIKLVSDTQVFDYWLPASGNPYYLDQYGHVFSGSLEKDTEVSEESFSALNRIEVSPDQNEVLAAFGNPAAPSWGIFDGLDKAWRPLPQNIINATWGVDSTKLYAIAASGQSYELAQIDISKNPAALKTLAANFHLKDVDLKLKDTQTLLLVEKPSANYPG